MKPNSNPQTYYILALVSQESEVYVWATVSNRWREIYKRHMLGGDAKTAHFFDKARPQFFLLETVKTTKVKARGRSMMWAVYFYTSGFQVPDWCEIEPYTCHPHPDDVTAYWEIARHDLNALCLPECDLARDYVYREAHHTIKLVVAPEELQVLKAAAVDKGLQLEAYCKKRFDNGCVESIDLSELRSCEQRCRQVVMLLERERRQGCLQSEDNPWMQPTIDELRCDVRALTAAIRAYVEVRE